MLCLPESKINPVLPPPPSVPVSSSSPAPVFPREASLFPFCPKKSILGGGLKDLSQEYWSTAWRSDKLPVTSSRDGAGQVRARHLRGEAFSSGHREERYKGSTLDHKSIGVGY